MYLLSKKKNPSLRNMIWMRRKLNHFSWIKYRKFLLFSILTCEPGLIAIKMTEFMHGCSNRFQVMRTEHKLFNAYQINRLFCITYHMRYYEILENNYQQKNKFLFHTTRTSYFSPMIKHCLYPSSAVQRKLSLSSWEPKAKTSKE